MARAFDFHRRSRRPAPPKLKPRPKIGGALFGLTIGLLTIFIIARILAASSQSTESKPAAPTVHPTPSQIVHEPLGPPSPTVTPEPIITASPSPTPSPEPTSASIDPQSITLRILNGSTTAGKANLLKADLEKKGFHVRTTAVAKTRRATTIIYYAPGQAEQAALVQTAIDSKESTISENASLTAPDDVLVVVGNQ